MLLALCTAFLNFAIASSVSAGKEPNPPNWPTSVKVISSSTPTEEIDRAISDAWNDNGGDPLSSCNSGQFSKSRYAFLFAPGEYTNDVPVGFYTTVHGLGTSPYDTIFSGPKGVYAEEGCGNFQVGSLDTFWRSAENFRTTTSEAWAVGTGMTWAVSQAAPLRNIVADNSILFYEYTWGDAAGYASGGWGSGLKVGGVVDYGSQQQFITRNSESTGGMKTAVWNSVHVGNIGAPEERCGGEDGGNVAVVENTGRVAEKPFITSDKTATTFKLVVPEIQDSAGNGVPFDEDGLKIPSKEIDFTSVYVTQEGDGSKEINEKLADGLSVVVSPGIYELEETLNVGDGQVLLGLGMATLIAPSTGDPCVTVTGDNARVAGLLLQAAVGVSSSSLLLVTGSDAVLSDVFARVGGDTTGVGPVGTMFNIEGDNAVIDNTWLWRADHIASDEVGGDDVLVKNGDNPVTNGMIVSGDNVTAYGLASEHTIEDNVLWAGEGGRVFFYQAEILYDFVEGDIWEHSCLKIEASDFLGVGLGCYSCFRDADATAVSGIDTGSMGGKVDKAVSVFLNGNGGIKNVIDDDGEEVKQGTQTAYHC